MKAVHFWILQLSISIFSSEVYVMCSSNENNYSSFILRNESNKLYRSKRVFFFHYELNFKGIVFKIKSHYDKMNLSYSFLDTASRRNESKTEIFAIFQNLYSILEGFVLVLTQIKIYTFEFKIRKTLGVMLTFRIRITSVCQRTANIERIKPLYEYPVWQTDYQHRLITI